MLLVLDNYDSFLQPGAVLGELGESPVVRRNDETLSTKLEMELREGHLAGSVHAGGGVDYVSAIRRG